MKHIRIELLGNESRLVYSNRQGLIEYSPIIYNQGLSSAYIKLRKVIQYKRTELKARNGPKDLGRKESGAMLKILSRKRRALARNAFEEKKPINKHRHVGVEIEFLSNSSQNDIAITLAEYNLTQFVELKTDSSVTGKSRSYCNGDCREDCNCAECGENHYCDDERACVRRTRNYGYGEREWEIRENCQECPMVTIEEENEEGVITTREISDCLGHCPGHACLGYEDHENYDCNCNCDCNCGSRDEGHEIAIVAKSSQICDIVTKVCKVLHMHDAEVNDTCGLHVHLDMRQYDEKKAFANLVKSQKLLFAMVPVNRYRSGYCGPNVSKVMDSYNTRYYAINPESFEEHGTIEIRLHSGTVNSVKINHWIKLLQKITYTNRKCIEINKLSDLTKNVRVDKELLSYISERIEKFSNKCRGDFNFIDDLKAIPAVQLDLLELPESFELTEIVDSSGFVTGLEAA